MLVACEFSGVVRDSFLALGHDAWSCDLLPSVKGGPHITGDVLDVLGEGWDLMVAHPPCTYLSASGLHWNKRVPGRAQKTEAALDFVRALMAAAIPHIAIENPVGRIGTAIRKSDQILQPYEYGHSASKRTCIWLQNLLPLVPDPAKRIQGRIVNGKERWDNQTPSGQNRIGQTADRWAKRSVTYAGIAEAMAAQWSAHIVSTKSS